MSLSGSERGILYEFGTQLEEIEKLVFPQYDRIKPTGDEPNLISPRDYHRIWTTGD